MNFLGIEIGGSKLQLATGSESGKIFEVARLEIEPASGAAAIRGKIEAYITEFKPRFDWQAIGVGFGGPVNWKTGRICRSHQVDGWNEFDLGDWLRDLSRLPVIVDNDSNLAAYAEAILGAGRGFNPVFYTNSGSGVGAGAVMDGSIYHGALLGEMEFGHLRLDREGTEIEHRCSGWAVDARIQAAIAGEPHGILADQVAVCGKPFAAALASSLEKNCPLARQILEETAESMAWGLSHVVHLVHPEVIVLGGGLAFIGESWREAIARKLRSFVMPAFLPGPQVRLSHFRDMVVPTGALLSAAAALRTIQIKPEHHDNKL